MTSFNIYDYASQKQIDSFKPTFLYIKQHTVTGMLYFGKTVQKDPITYRGSGKLWTLHFRKHGKDSIETLWYCLFTEIETLVKTALHFSIQNDIVNSTNWANLMLESGLNGSEGYKFTEEQKLNMSIAQRNITRTYVQTEEHKQRVSNALKGKIFPRNSQAQIEAPKKMKETLLRKQSIWMHNFLGKNIRVNKEHINEAIAQGCLLGYAPGTHNGWPDNTGRKHTNETKLKMSDSSTGRKHTGEFKARLRTMAENRPKSECPHCHRIIDNFNYKRWHGDKCKMLPHHLLV